jgi:acetyl esterase/lipase
LRFQHHRLPKLETKFMLPRRLFLAMPALLAACASSPDPTGEADQEMRALLESFAKLNPRPIERLDAVEARRQPSLKDAVEARLREQGRQPTPREMAHVQDISIPTPMGPTLRGRLYVPPGANMQGRNPLVVYYHGGGWVIADLDTYDASARALAAESGAVVLSVHYRQGPEVRFPGAHEDAVSAWRWAAANAAQLGGDVRRMAVVGESAGGNLALNVAIAARDQGLPRPVAIGAIYPVAGTDLETPSYARYAGAKPLNKPMIQWFVRNYTRGDRDLMDSRLNLYRRANLAGLPRTLIVNAQIDPLLDDGARLEEAMTRAGSPVRRIVHPGVTHEFFGADTVLSRAQIAQREMGEELRAAFAAVPAPVIPPEPVTIRRPARGQRVSSR